VFVNELITDVWRKMEKIISDKEKLTRLLTVLNMELQFTKTKLEFLRSKQEGSVHLRMHVLADNELENYIMEADSGIRSAIETIWQTLAVVTKDGK
jgi:hypothetical protein